MTHIYTGKPCYVLTIIKLSIAQKVKGNYSIIICHNSKFSVRCTNSKHGKFLTAVFTLKNVNSYLIKINY